MLWGIDLGGHKIEGVVLSSAQSAEPLWRKRHDTEAHLGFEHIVERIALLVEWIEEETGLRRPPRIGIGTPGTVDPPTGLMKNCNTECLNGQPLLSRLEDRLDRQVMIANDANCFALAEATLGSGRGREVVFGVILGSGVGGGVVVHGRVLAGLQGIAGEWGHNVVEPDGRNCYCGRVGCVETVISGPSLERWHREQTGRSMKFREIALLEGSDPGARDTVDRLCEFFGRSLAQVVNVLDPHAVILGGGVGQTPALLTRGRDALRRNVFNLRLDTELLTPELGDSAGVFGAAMLTAGGV